MLSTFDCPNFNKMVVERTISNSPLMALTALNDRTLFAAARALAKRVLTEGRATKDQNKMQFISQLSLGRELNEAEQVEMLSFLNTQRKGFQRDSKLAALMVDGTPPDVTTETVAAWVAVARVFLNLDEFITRH